MFHPHKAQLMQAYSFCHINFPVFSESCPLCRVMLVLATYTSTQTPKFNWISLPLNLPLSLVPTHLPYTRHMNTRVF